MFENSCARMVAVELQPCLVLCFSSVGFWHLILSFTDYWKKISFNCSHFKLKCHMQSGAPVILVILPAHL